MSRLLLSAPLLRLSGITRGSSPLTRWSGFYRTVRSSSSSISRKLPNGGPKEKTGVNGSYNSWISGQHGRHIVIESAKNSCMIGAHFRPGGANPFLDLPLSELNDSVVEMELIWHGAIHELRERLLASPSVDERFRLLEQALLCRAAGRLELDSRVSWAFIAQDAGYFDQSHFIRDFQSLSGLNPSRYLVDKGEYLNFLPTH